MLQGQSPTEWIAADRGDGPLANFWAEASGGSTASGWRAFPGLKLPDIASLLPVGWPRAAEMALISDTLRLVNPTVLSGLSAINASGVQAMLAAAEPARQAAEILRDVSRTYVGLAPILRNIQESERAWLANVANIQKQLGGLRVSPGLELSALMAGSFTDVGLGAWADVTLAPSVAAGLDAHEGLVPEFNREGKAYEAWAQAVANPSDSQAGPPTRVIRVHVTARAAIATLPLNWPRRSDAGDIAEAVEILTDVRLGLDLEVPGTGRSLEEILERHFPATLEGLRGMVAALALSVPNGPKMAAFSFRDALRAFARELTGQPSHGDARTALRQILGARVTDPTTGDYLIAAIGFLHYLYKPIAEAVYGHGGDRESLRAWLQSASAAMAAILEAWWVTVGPGAVPTDGSLSGLALGERPG